MQEKKQAVQALENELHTDLSKLANVFFNQKGDVDFDEVMSQLQKVEHTAQFHPNVLARELLQDLNAFVQEAKTVTDPEIQQQGYAAVDLIQRLYLEDHLHLFDRWFSLRNELRKHVGLPLLGYDALDQDLQSLRTAIQSSVNQRYFAAIQRDLQQLIAAQFKKKTDTAKSLSEDIMNQLSMINTSSNAFVLIRQFLDKYLLSLSTPNALKFLGRFERSIHRQQRAADNQPMLELLRLIIDWKLPNEFANKQQTEGMLMPSFAQMKLKQTQVELKLLNMYQQQEYLNNQRFMLNVYSLVNSQQSLSMQESKRVIERLEMMFLDESDLRCKLDVLIESQQKLAAEMATDFARLIDRYQSGTLFDDKLRAGLNQLIKCSGFGNFHRLRRTMHDFSQWLDSEEVDAEKVPLIMVDIKNGMEQLQENEVKTEPTFTMKLANILMGTETETQEQVETDEPDVDTQALDSLEMEPGDVLFDEGSPAGKKSEIPELKITQAAQGATQKTRAFAQSEPLLLKPGKFEKSEDSEEHEGEVSDEKFAALEAETQMQEQQSSDTAHSDNQNDSEKQSEIAEEAAQGEAAANIEIDPFILEIFLDEAQELIKHNDELIRAWPETEQTENSVQELRKNFHTIKGSSRMAGCEELGALGWSSEHILNSLMKEQSDYHPVYGAAFTEVNQKVADCVATLKATGREGEDVYGLVAKLDELLHVVKTQDDEQAELLKTLEGRFTAKIQGSDSDDAGSEDNQLASSLNLKLQDHYRRVLKQLINKQADERIFAELIQQWYLICGKGDLVTKQSMSLKDLSQELDDTQYHQKKPELEESTGALILSQHCEQVVAASFEDAQDVDIQTLQQELSLLTLLSDVQGRYAPIHNVVDVVLDISQQEPVNKQWLQLGCEMILKQLDSLASGLVIPLGQEYINYIDLQNEALAAAQGLPSSSKNTNLEADPVADSTELNVAEMGSVPETVEQESLAQAKSELTEAEAISEQKLGALDESLTKAIAQGEKSTNTSDSEIQNEAVEARSETQMDLEDGAAQSDASEEPTDASANSFKDEMHSIYQLLDSGAPSTTKDDDEAEEEMEIDPELQAIFLDEAQELMERYAVVLSSWETQSPPGDSINDIQRILHTIKGSAYSAQFLQMGNLAHQLEERIDVAQESLTQSDAWLEEMETIYHELEDTLLEVTQGPSEPADSPDAAEPHAANANLQSVAQASTSPQSVSSVASLAQKVTTTSSSTAKKSAGKGQAAFRLPTDFLKEISDLSSESNMSRAQLEMNLKSVGQIFGDVNSTISRLNESVKELEKEAIQQTTQARSAKSREAKGEFDALEMDKYPKVYELSQRLSEMALDFVDYRNAIEECLQNMDLALMQQQKASRELSLGLQMAQMVSLNAIAPRVKKVVKDIGRALGKDVELKLEGMDAMISRPSVQTLIFSLEHLIRNAIYHGIEPLEERLKYAKPTQGRITLTAKQTADALQFIVQDDGAGIDAQKVYKKAVEKGVVAKDAKLDEAQIQRLIFAPNFSTSATTNEISGRGIGLDAVVSELQKIGGKITVSSKPRKGTRFNISLPYNVNSNSVLMVRVMDTVFGIPLIYVKGISRLSGEKEWQEVEYAGNHHQVFDSSLLFFGEAVERDQDKQQCYVVLEETQAFYALKITEFLGVHEVSHAPVHDILKLNGLYSGVSVGTDGRVMMLFNPQVLIREHANTPVEGHVDKDKVAKKDKQAKASPIHSKKRYDCMIVDDSITVRKVTERLLKRNDFTTETAKDGLDALEKIEDKVPRLILLDLEMPRLDGFEFMKVLRQGTTYADVKVVMITSRVGEKHRKRAMELGVNEYIGKPYDDKQLIARINHWMNQDE
ncbi:MAG: response regulator [Pseudomonadota bacterium]|nr:response regulator [Pseudomonadota bacterium]